MFFLQPTVKNSKIFSVQWYKTEKSRCKCWKNWFEKCLQQWVSYPNDFKLISCLLTNQLINIISTLVEGLTRDFQFPGWVKLRNHRILRFPKCNSIVAFITLSHSGKHPHLSNTETQAFCFLNGEAEILKWCHWITQTWQSSSRDTEDFMPLFYRLSCSSTQDSWGATLNQNLMGLFGKCHWESL